MMLPKDLVLLSASVATADELRTMIEQLYDEVHRLEGELMRAEADAIVQRNLAQVYKTLLDIYHKPNSYADLPA